MKFAVIEYNSKTGRIWKHAPQNPNYLADPEKEIDPTSFGCYVSAMAGEHVPLTGLIIGDIYNIGPLTRLRRRIFKKILGRWPQDYSLEYLRGFDVMLVVHQVSNGHEMTRFTKRLQQTYPQTVVIGVPTQPYGILKKHWEIHPRQLEDFQNFMNHCDAFITITREIKDDWQKLTKTPVEYQPQPYPAEYASRCFLQPESKDKTIFVAGVTERDNIRRGQTVAKLLQHEFPNYSIYVTKTPGTTLTTAELSGARFTVVHFEPWRKHLVSLSKTMLVINTDFTFTRGRVQMDCAAVGTPSIGANSDAQKDLFPKLAANPDTLIDDLVERGRKLLSNNELYRQTVTAAREKLPHYNYPQTAKRVEELVEKYRKKTVDPSQ